MATTKRTRIIDVKDYDAIHPSTSGSSIDTWQLPSATSDALSNLQAAAQVLRSGNVPVAFPTETVYGLAADATRSDAVKGIYLAKGRPSDNPLIIHVSDLEMLRNLLATGSGTKPKSELIPDIYKPLLARFWPGPLTILLRNTENLPLAPEVTAGLGTFAVRMPASGLARSLIKLAGVPLAGPSANASTKPSPTTAQHVLDDLDGRVDLILDGGPCPIGVESTVVDGLCDPPVILRPGGLTIEEIRTCAGWERVEKEYQDQAELDAAAIVRSPGTKYKHYSPKASVILYEAAFPAGCGLKVGDDAEKFLNLFHHTPVGSIGIIRTKYWEPGASIPGLKLVATGTGQDLHKVPIPKDKFLEWQWNMGEPGAKIVKVWDIGLGEDGKKIAQGLFGALRELDARGADIIFVEGIDDGLDMASAVMNRLRKAAAEIIYESRDSQQGVTQ